MELSKERYVCRGIPEYLCNRLVALGDEAKKLEKVNMYYEGRPQLLILFLRVPGYTRSSTCSGGGSFPR